MLDWSLQSDLECANISRTKIIVRRAIFFYLDMQKHTRPDGKEGSDDDTRVYSWQKVKHRIFRQGRSTVCSLFIYRGKASVTKAVEGNDQYLLYEIAE